MTSHSVGTREEWLEEGMALLVREKELTRRSDELARQRQALPWVPVEKEYVFDTNEGPKTLAELFDGRPQPKGRGDDFEDWPRRHDEYETAAAGR